MSSKSLPISVLMTKRILVHFLQFRPKKSEAEEFSFGDINIGVCCALSMYLYYKDCSGQNEHFDQL